MQSLIYILNFFLQNKFKRLNTLQNIHRDEICYIFGDGVSIKHFNIKNFSNFKSIVCGKLYLHNDFEYLNCQYIVNCDPFFITPFFLNLKNKYGADPNSKNKKFLTYDPISLNLKNFIDENKNINFLVDITNYPFVNGNNVFYISRFFRDYKLNKIFSKLNSYEMFGQTLPTAITLAIFLGFKKIYLVGCDYTHFPSRNSHWFENQLPKIWYKKYLNYMKAFFREATKHVKITTITLDGVSKNLEYITYKEFTNTDPIYYENSKLLTENNIRTLSSSKWFGYKT